MCGIAGFWHPTGAGGRLLLEQRALAMADAVGNRGPDYRAAWADESAGIGLGHVRLAVLDLSSAANQPLHSSDGRYTIVFNGEIYNYRELGSELRQLGYTFRTSGDTEIIPAAIDAWGLADAAAKLNGIFAFALWDRHTQQIHLVRDHVGVKPLYYQLDADGLIFGSTPRALRAHPDFKRGVDPQSLALYMRYCYVPEPRTIFTSTSKLSPGCAVTIDSSLRAAHVRYWDIAGIARNGLCTLLPGSEEDVAREFEALAVRAIQQQLVSDVPIGTFLSGGIDSSLVTALMGVAGASRVRTFTIGFEDRRFDESAQARDVARHLGTEHTEMICTAREAKDLIPELPAHYDEPFADSSQIPTLLLARLTRAHVTVALSGDGGDELFAGYDRYYWMHRMHSLQVRLPRFMLHWMIAASVLMPRARTFSLLRRWPGAPSGLIPRADAFYHLARMIQRPDDFAYLYRTTPMSVATLRDGPVLRDEREPPTAFDDPELHAAFPNVLDWMQIVDQKTYLVEDILHKVDRASMAFGLEARVPLLDRRLVEFSWRVPQAMKMRGMRGKRLMRTVLARFLPRALIERPKRGFSVPLREWLTGDLRDWAESLLDSRALELDALLDPARVRACWSNYLTGRADHTQGTIWAILMFLAWRERYGG